MTRHAKRAHAKARRRKAGRNQRISAAEAAKTTALATVKTAPVAGEDSELTRVYGSDQWLVELSKIEDDRAFRGAALQRFKFFGRVNVLTAVAVGQILALVKDRLPGQFSEWLEEADIADRTARTYMSFARHANSIIDSKAAQSVGFKQLAVLCAMPAEEFDRAAKLGTLGEMTFEEIGALPPSQVRKLVRDNRIGRQQMIDAARQLDENKEHIERLGEEIDKLRAGADRKDDPETADDAAFKQACEQRYDRIDATLQAFLRCPPGSRKQAAELYGWCIRTAMIIETFIYSPVLLDRLQPEIRAALEQVRDSIGKIRDED